MTATHSAGSILALDPANPDHVAAAADLYARLLPDSPIPQFGREFMTRFYFSDLVRDGIIQSDLFACDGRFVAVSVYTRYPFSFMKRGFTKHFAKVAWILGKAVLTKPARATALWKAVRHGGMRSGERDTPEVGEYLSLGVLPEYASARDASGLRVPQAMFERVMETLGPAGVREILLMIRKDNLKSMRFYQSYDAAPRAAGFLLKEHVLWSVKLEPQAHT